jgi:hypothetical protein
MWLAVAGVAALLAAHPMLFKAVQYARRRVPGLDRLPPALRQGGRGVTDPHRAAPVRPPGFPDHSAQPQGHRLLHGLLSAVHQSCSAPGRDHLRRDGRHDRPDHRGLLPDPVPVRPGRRPPGACPCRRLPSCSSDWPASSSSPSAFVSEPSSTHFNAADFLHRQPEGRRRQDHDDRQPRRRARAGRPTRARRRPRPAGQCHDGVGGRQARPAAHVYDVLLETCDIAGPASAARAAVTTCWAPTANSPAPRSSWWSSSAANGASRAHC